MLLVEERLFPGEELAAAMMMTASSGSGVGNASATEQRDSSERDRGKTSPFSETEGGLGEDGSAAWALKFIAECMLEVGVFPLSSCSFSSLFINLNCLSRPWRCNASDGLFASEAVL